MKMFQKWKEPRTLLVFVIVLAACGFGGLAILSQVSANPAFCVSCHNMQPESAREAACGCGRDLPRLSRADAAPADE